ncbi:MAG TPA: zinc metalloprotease HtpX [Humibacillus sp.]|nr:zinc metalloprotease HtpX [Humibacillus sp.]
MRPSHHHPLIAVSRRPRGRLVMAPAPVPGPRHRLRNLVQELLLLTGMAVVLGTVAWLLTGVTGLVWVLLVVVVLGALRPRVPTEWVLSMYQAQPVPRWAAPRLHEIVDVLAARAELDRRPALFYIASPVANAFVVGRRDDAALAVTDGLLRVLTARELVGVLAHEISHLRNGDTSIMSLSDVVARLAQWMGWVGLWSVAMTFPLAIAGGSFMPVLLSLLLVVVPTVVTLMQLAVSRSREYDADLDALALTGDPEGLARALVALEVSDGRIWERILVGRSAGPDPLLVQTHPSTEERVRRLRAVQVESSGRPLDGQHGLTVSYPRVTHRPRLRRTGIRW